MNLQLLFSHSTEHAQPRQPCCTAQPRRSCGVAIATIPYSAGSPRCRSRQPRPHLVAAALRFLRSSLPGAGRPSCPPPPRSRSEPPLPPAWAAAPPQRARAAPHAPFPAAPPTVAPPRAHERRGAPWRPGLRRRPVVPRAPHTKDALGNGGGRGLAKRPRENGAAPGGGRGGSGGSASAQRGGRRGGAAPQEVGGP